jgi:hypothetical protein
MYQKEYGKIENRCKQIIALRLHKVDHSYFNSLSSVDKQVYLNTQSVQKKLLGNTIKLLVESNKQVQNFTDEQLHQRIKGY